MQKERLDTLLVENKLATSIKSARALIGAGQVFIDGQRADKSGEQFAIDCTIEVKETQPYVSRGGLKLKAGLQHFGLDPKGKVCADIGCSTGGFTDCLLQHGAKKEPFRLLLVRQPEVVEHVPTDASPVPPRPTVVAGPWLVVVSGIGWIPLIVDSSPLGA